MLKKTITYEDYNGVERKEDFYFNLSKVELTEMQMGADGGMSEYLQKIVDAKDSATIMEMFKTLILKAYGEKVDDGKRFKKSKELSEAFSQTPAYEVLYMELAFDADAAAKFVKGIVPADIAKQMDKK